jgi:hypothetical protein
MKLVYVILEQSFLIELWAYYRHIKSSSHLRREAGVCRLLGQEGGQRDRIAPVFNFNILIEYYWSLFGVIILIFWNLRLFAVSIRFLHI